MDSGFMMNEIEPKELFEKLKNESILLVDVRSEEEFASHHIEGSLFHPITSFNPKEISTDVPVVFICRSGARSKKATDLYLAQHPKASAYNLTGGLLAWGALKLPLVTP
jgi:rhodanese-related sulfurtransferase